MMSSNNLSQKPPEHITTEESGWADHAPSIRPPNKDADEHQNPHEASEEVAEHCFQLQQAVQPSPLFTKIPPEIRDLIMNSLSAADIVVLSSACQVSLHYEKYAYERDVQRLRSGMDGVSSTAAEGSDREHPSLVHDVLLWKGKDGQKVHINALRRIIKVCEKEPAIINGTWQPNCPHKPPLIAAVNNCHEDGVALLLESPVLDLNVRWSGDEPAWEGVNFPMHYEALRCHVGTHEKCKSARSKWCYNALEYAIVQIQTKRRLLLYQSSNIPDLDLPYLEASARDMPALEKIAIMLINTTPEIRFNCLDLAKRIAQARSPEVLRAYLKRYINESHLMTRGIAMQLIKGACKYKDGEELNKTIGVILEYSDRVLSRPRSTRNNPEMKQSWFVHVLQEVLDEGNCYQAALFMINHPLSELGQWNLRELYYTLERVTGDDQKLAMTQMLIERLKDARSIAKHSLSREALRGLKLLPLMGYVRGPRANFDPENFVNPRAKTLELLQQVGFRFMKQHLVVACDWNDAEMVDELVTLRGIDPNVIVKVKRLGADVIEEIPILEYAITCQYEVASRLYSLGADWNLVSQERRAQMIHEVFTEGHHYHGHMVDRIRQGELV